MKSALCAVAIFVVAGLSSNVGVGLPLSGTEASGSIPPVTRRNVFVDKAELARLHPGWQDLSDMKKVLAGALKSAPGANSVPSTAGRSRSELAAKTALDASKALDGLESRKYAALKARREAMKSQMMKSAEAEWKAEARNIEEAAAVETKAIDESHSTDLVNARLRVSAAQVASKVSKLDGSGMDKTAAEKDLQDVKSSLEGIAGVDSAEKNRVVASANAKVNALKENAEKQIDDKLNAYEADQSKRIAGTIADARTEIARELGPSSAPVLFAVKSQAGSLASLQSSVSALETRIDKDVDLVVRELAADRGLNVVFQRRGSRVPDVTTVFMNLIKKHGWNAGGPVIDRLGSS